jgi:hypothetical protein
LVERQARWQSAKDINEVKTTKDKNEHRCNIRSMTQQSSLKKMNKSLLCSDT